MAYHGVGQVRMRAAPVRAVRRPARTAPFYQRWATRKHQDCGNGYQDKLLTIRGYHSCVASYATYLKLIQTIERGIEEGDSRWMPVCRQLYQQGYITPKMYNHCTRKMMRLRRR